LTTGAGDAVTKGDALTFVIAFLPAGTVAGVGSAFASQGEGVAFLSCDGAFRIGGALDAKTCGGASGGLSCAIAVAQTDADAAIAIADQARAAVVAGGTGVACERAIGVGFGLAFWSGFGAAFFACVVVCDLATTDTALEARATTVFGIAKLVVITIGIARTRDCAGDGTWDTDASIHIADLICIAFAGIGCGVISTSQIDTAQTKEHR
jgi:hypothetical protein